MRRTSAEQPVVITTARESSDEEFSQRRRKYAVMMTIRGLAVVGAAAFYHVSFWISLAFCAAGVVLPWCAVLIANDNPPKSKRATIRPSLPPIERSLPAPGEATTVDADSADARSDDASSKSDLHSES